MEHTRTLLIMAGGRSERMRSGGSGDHKSLRRVSGAPLIEWNLRSALHFGFTDVFIAINVEESAIAGWSENTGSLIAASAGAHLHTIIETYPLGTIGAARRLPTDAENAVVVNVDNLTDLNLRTFADFHSHSGAAATIAVHDQSFRIPFGRAVLSDGFISAYEEKPEIRVTISSGAYVLARRAINHLPEAARTDVPEFIGSLISSRERVAAHHHFSRWIDVNDEIALPQAELILASAGESWPGACNQRNYA
jgi:NDP-sugar pyrophosphorylase family protein